jgi:hypothetical protein
VFGEKLEAQLEASRAGNYDDPWTLEQTILVDANSKRSTAECGDDKVILFDVCTACAVCVLCGWVGGWLSE